MHAHGRRSLARFLAPLALIAFTVAVLAIVIGSGVRATTRARTSTRPERSARGHRHDGDHDHRRSSKPIRDDLHGQGERHARRDRREDGRHGRALAGRSTPTSTRRRSSPGRRSSCGSERSAAACSSRRRRRSSRPRRSADAADRAPACPDGARRRSWSTRATATVMFAKRPDARARDREHHQADDRAARRSSEREPARRVHRARLRRHARRVADQPARGRADDGAATCSRRSCSRARTTPR